MSDHDDDEQEKSGKKRHVDELIDEKNLENREIFLWGGVDDQSAEKIIRRLCYLNAKNHDDIKLFVNSPGGVISSGLAIIDTMNMIESDVSTICLGQAASMGAIILALGTKGKRYITANARVMIHQPLMSGQIFGPATDIQIQATEILRIRTRINQLFAESTGKKIDQIEIDTDRDYFMEAQEAIAYGIVDGLFSSTAK